ncbi:hypothetical protein DAEQUDRAFT_91804 [Daedalea quercina L-15889]|uniref:Uncharacterized protein n=1 Tax=Daedalea quercina L-15889 TaxID=1314783 RepID=A0A165S8J8_9APHY|nr:hypothetical protein DAEQUDRAFT_91804 [Daedalea quercina L-15889]
MILQLVLGYKTLLRPLVNASDPSSLPPWHGGGAVYISAEYAGVGRCPDADGILRKGVIIWNGGVHG